ncbi:hypothetical protein P175DRAFT_0501382 [Aspergillus ochraceoroseus IBT 24754]|uniref:Uncharacterized protein n=2 Tax=Aspergillus subgen. Nidulantes TaxID=2720870 RepID=A0A0F8UWC9_9EURO|nr:uncharacterized protein P175DRAFT_0501382 [Aspergillus ochraceoroseus IBT 24754]KKK23803.1 hypothetical protein ARAM_001505 [Aspergillus rambellii]PTU20755.1 hypothetical protein P175DRAFT_0501382 [Aspergillus ochraceoroseus IBT 24754]
MNQERAGRELEGTAALGSSSHDGDRGSRSQRRTHSSSGFLVDSSFLPRSRSLRSSYHRPRHSDSDYGNNKRGAPEVNTPPKKRSRFPWSRQKESPKEAHPGSPKITAGRESPGPSRLRHDTTVIQPQNESVGNQATVGLDRDSLQIVNLALNLSESRRRGNIGYSASTRTSGGNWATSGDSHAPLAASSLASPGQAMGDGRSRSLRSPDVNLSANDVLNLLPDSAASDSLPHGVSASTLARAAKARRHFELFHEYLRLLPSLPPLAPPDRLHSTADPPWISNYGSLSHRAYNPLQAIRNRKVRFRERCPIDPEADGWTDVEKVHNWVNSVEAKHSRQTRSPLECLQLPPFQSGQHDALSSERPDDADSSAISPPSSLQRVSRTNSVKTPRPRSDWVITPDEFLADAAWVEEAENKSKIVDSDGNILYPDFASLIADDAREEQTKTKGLNKQSSSHASLSDHRQSTSIDLNEIGRGRPPHRFRNPERIGHSSSASAKDVVSKRHKLRMRSRSSSSSSSTDDGPSRNSLVAGPASTRRYISPSRTQAAAWTKFDEKRGSMSSVPSADDRYDPLSLAMKENRISNTAMDISYFPSIASNLSATSSRSPSPPKRGFTRAIGSRRAQSRGSTYRKDGGDDSSPESDAMRKDAVAGYTEPASQPDNEPPPTSSQVPTTSQEGPARTSLHERKDSAPHESKLRGIFKGPGKIAGKVGNEVSKMGDFILKKDTLAHSRKSSFATSDGSEPEEEETKSDKRAIPRAILRRFPTFSDDAGRSSPRNSDKSLAKNNALLSHMQDDERRVGGNIAGSHGHLSGLQLEEVGELPGKDGRRPFSLHQGNLTDVARHQKPLEFGPELYTVREQIKKGRIKDLSMPFSLARPPITGLAQAQPTQTSASHEKRPPLPTQSSSWSISDRSLSISVESGVPGKQEIERTRALLLSSGIKAREITRRAETVRSPPAEFLRRSFGTDASIPSVPRLYEYDLASQNLLKRIEASHNLFQSSVDRFPQTTFSPLKSQLSMLEELVNERLNPRVHAAAQEAENLSVQLNTTSTLAVKQLSETLDRGIRKRHRRLRWLRRTGFVMLEWALVGLLWWVWLIVVAFKLLRKLLYGMASGVRWVLWL